MCEWVVFSEHSVYRNHVPDCQRQLGFLVFTDLLCYYLTTILIMYHSAICVPCSSEY